MLVAMKNLAIIQHWDMLRYAIIRGGGCRPLIHKFELGDYVYL